MTWLDSVTRTFAARCVSAAASLGYALLLADVLAPADMGEFVIAVSVAVIAANIAKSGLDLYLMRHAAERPQEALRLTIRCLSAAALVGAAACAVCAPVGSGFRPAAGIAFGMVQLAIPFLAMNFVLTGLLKAGNLPSAAVFLETGAWQSVMCICAVVMQYAGSASLLLAAGCFAAGSAVAFAGFFAGSGRFVFGRKPSPPQEERASAVRFREVAPLAGASAARVLMRWSDTLWLAWWLDAQTVAVYVVCTRLAGAVSFIDHAVNAIAAPRFARYHERGDARSLRRGFLRACATSGACGILGALAISLLAPFILGRLDPLYADAAGIVLLAAALMAVNVTLAPAGYLAAMSGRAPALLKASCVALALQQTAFFLLIPRFGVFVAVAGFALTPALANLLTLAILRRRT